MFGLCLLAALEATGSPVVDDHEARARAPAVQLGIGGGAVEAAHGFASGSLGVLPALGPRWALEIVGQAGYAPSVRDVDALWIRIAVGLRWEDRLRPVRPWIAGRLVHLHLAPSATWREHPGASIAGDSSHGLEHRSGAAIAAGVGFDRALLGIPLRWSFGVEASFIPIGNGPRWFPGADATIAVPL